MRYFYDKINILQVNWLINWMNSGSFFLPFLRINIEVKVRSGECSLQSLWWRQDTWKSSRGFYSGGGLQTETGPLVVHEARASYPPVIACAVERICVSGWIVAGSMAVALGVPLYNSWRGQMQMLPINQWHRGSTKQVEPGCLSAPKISVLSWASNEKLALGKLRCNLTNALMPAMHFWKRI